MCSAFLRCAIFSAALVSAAMPLQARQLRICVDPNNLPYSHIDGSGLENRIARLIAEKLEAELVFTWHPQHRGFIRKTLNARLCDVIMGVPVGLDMLRTTRPYYRSSYAFVGRADESPITSYDDPLLKSLKIGVHLVGDDGMNTPPVHDLAQRGIVDNVRGFMIYGDSSSPAPLAPIFAALARGDIDVEIVWGPIAGYFAPRESVLLSVTPMPFNPERHALQMTFDIAMGVRNSDGALLLELNAAIEKNAQMIDRLLDEFNVPQANSVIAGGIAP